MHPTITTNKTTNTKTKNNSSNAQQKTKALTEEQKILREFGIEGDLASDFIKHRKSKRAPITNTAMSGIAREAAKAGISNSVAVSVAIEANWQGFEAKWYFNRQQKSPVSATNRRPGFTKQPMQRPDYSRPVRNGDAIDSTCTVDYT